MKSKDCYECKRDFDDGEEIVSITWVCGETKQENRAFLCVECYETKKDTDN